MSCEDQSLSLFELTRKVNLDWRDLDGFQPFCLIFRRLILGCHHLMWKWTGFSAPSPPHGGFFPGALAILGKGDRSTRQTRDETNIRGREGGLKPRF